MSAIKLSSLANYETVDEFILSFSHISKQHLKRLGLKKSFRNKKVHYRDVLEFPIGLINDGIVNPSYSGDELRILHEDKFIIALHKPVGVHCHPHLYEDTSNILSWLRKNNKGEALKVNINRRDRGLLYRIDRETSGIVILAKNDEIYRDVRNLKSSIVVEKIYLAVVHGHFILSGTQKHYLSSYGPKGYRMRENPDGQLALSEMSPISYNKKRDLTLVRVNLKTGLRHQIRAQLFLLGHPIMGDELYDGKSAERMYLHAYQYEINWRGKNWRITDSLEESFQVLFNLNGDL